MKAISFGPCFHIINRVIAPEIDIVNFGPFEPTRSGAVNFIADDFQHVSHNAL
jgi:hypothetical protein